jgi:hypothetical protein
VAGRPDVDVAVLKRHTRYEGFSGTDAVPKRFWRVFASLSRKYSRGCGHCEINIV